MTLIQKFSEIYKTPFAVQKFLRQMPYNREHRGETIYSAETALRKKTCHCLEAVFIAAALLENHNYEPLILTLESDDHLDHVVYLFQQNKKWGAIARSRDPGLHGRAPAFATIEALVRSYVEPYVDKTGRIRRYQVFHLDETLCDWRNSPHHLWNLETYLNRQKCIPLKTSDSHYKNTHKKYLQYGPLLKGPHWW